MVLHAPPVQDLEREERGTDRRAEQHRERGRHARDRQAAGLDRVRAGATARPARQRAAGRHERRFGPGGTAGGDRQHRHRHERAQRTHARSRRPTRGCCRRAAPRRRDCRATRAITVTTHADTAEHARTRASRSEVLRRERVLEQVDRQEVGRADRATADPDEQRRAEQRGREAEGQPSSRSDAFVVRKHIVYDIPVRAGRPAGDLDRRASTATPRLPDRAAAVPALERGAGNRGSGSRRPSTSCCWRSAAIATRSGRRSATSPSTCCCATTARSASSTARWRRTSSSASPTPTTSGSFGYG